MLTQMGMRRGLIRAAALPALLLAGLLTGCADWNDDPAGGMSVTVRIGDGDTLTDGISSPSNSETIRSIVVGAIVITHDRDPSTSGVDPYTDAEQVDDAAKSKLSDDAIQSAAYLTIVDLPSSGDTISFLIPPGAAGKWQLIGVGTREDINVLQDLEDNDDAPIWYGFFPEFQNGKVNPGDTKDLTLQPGCNLDFPPVPPC